MESGPLYRSASSRACRREPSPESPVCETQRLSVGNAGMDQATAVFPDSFMFMSGSAEGYGVSVFSVSPDPGPILCNGVWESKTAELKKRIPARWNVQEKRFMAYLLWKDRSIGLAMIRG